MTIEQLKKAIDIFADCDPAAEIIAADFDEIVIESSLHSTSPAGVKLKALGWKGGDEWDEWACVVVKDF